MLETARNTSLYTSLRCRALLNVYRSQHGCEIKNSLLYTNGLLSSGFRSRIPKNILTFEVWLIDRWTCFCMCRKATLLLFRDAHYTGMLRIAFHYYLFIFLHMPLKLHKYAYTSKKLQNCVYVPQEDDRR